MKHKASIMSSHATARNLGQHGSTPPSNAGGLLQSFLSPAILDDAGRPARLNRNAWNNRRHLAETVAAKRAARVLVDWRHRLQTQGTTPQSQGAVVALTLCKLVPLVAFIIIFFRYREVLDIYAVALILVAFIAVFALIWRLFFNRSIREASHSITRDILAQGVCPQCATALTQISKTSPNRLELATKPLVGRPELGCCPVCDAAWDIAKIRQGSPAMLRADQAERPGAFKSFLKRLFISPIHMVPVITDAAGIRVPVYDAPTQERLDDEHDELTQRRRSAISRVELFGQANPRTMLEWNLLFVLVVLYPYVIYSGFTRTDGSSLYKYILPIFLLLCLPGLWIFVVRLRKAAKYASKADGLAQQLLAANLCPSCAGDLEAVEPDDHGHRTCPQCAAVWEHNHDTESPNHPSTSA